MGENKGPSICFYVVGASQTDLLESLSQTPQELPSTPPGGPGMSPVVTTPQLRTQRARAQMNETGSIWKMPRYSL